MRRLTTVALIIGALSVAVVFLFLRAPLTPEGASAQSRPIDNLLTILFSILAVIFVLVMVLLVYSVAVFRRRTGDASDGPPIEGHTGLEIAWTLIPLAIVIFLGVYAAVVLKEITAAPHPSKRQDAEPELEVKVTAFQWGWTFEYPQYGIISPELWLPVNRPVRFRLISKDVIHSFWVPEFRVKQDAVPGMETELRVTPTKVGEYRVQCAELCGLSHAFMVAPVKVVEGFVFQRWAEELAIKPRRITEEGQRFAQQFGCLACHSTDGTIKVGPSFQGLFGSVRTLQDGTTVVADEAYLRESILNPSAKIVKDFPPVMPKIPLSEEQLQAIIEYLKSLGQTQKGEP